MPESGDDKPSKIFIGGEAVETDLYQLDIDDLYYLPTNPRIKTLLPSNYTDKTKEEIQLIIADKLFDEASVQSLLTGIQETGGLKEPVFVRMDKMVVVEGNSRLRVYRHLKEKFGHETDEWNKISCLAVSKLTDDQQWAYLHDIHVKGKTPWAAYEKANVSYTMVIEEGRRVDEVAKILTTKPNEVNKQIQVIKLMKKNNDTKRERFSYYDQMIRNRKISIAIENNPELKKSLLTRINPGKDKEIAFTAQEMRDKLPAIIAKPKEVKKFIKKDATLQESYQRAKLSGPRQKLNDVLDKLKDLDADEFRNIRAEDIADLKYATRKIKKELSKVEGIIKRL